MKAGSATIRPARAEDAAPLADLAAATFVATFGHLYSKRDLDAFLESSRSASRYARMLEDPACGVWLAQLDARLVGYAVVGSCKLPVENLEPTAGEIQELYVLADFQGHRLGTGLLKTALEWLAQRQRHPLFIGVWSENRGAQRLYERFGFKRVGEYGFPVGDHIDHEFILKRDA